MSLKFSEIGIMIGYVFVIFGFLYFIGLALNTQNIVEGMSAKRAEEGKLSPGKLAEAMEELNGSLKDNLNLGKHRAAYQDALSQIHENVHLSILQAMSNSEDAVPTDKELDKIQKLRNYKDTVAELEEFLDGVKD
jgi:hypothetical protein